MESKFKTYGKYFADIKQLCIDAFHDGIITDEKFFIDSGIPSDFLKECKKAHLYGGGKNGQNIYWNWHTNKLYPKSTIDNFLDFLEKEENK